MRGGRRFGFEFKRSTAPEITPSMRAAARDLGLKRLYIVHAGARSFPLGSQFHALALARLLTDLPAWE